MLKMDWLVLNIWDPEQSRGSHGSLWISCGLHRIPFGSYWIPCGSDRILSKLFRIPIGLLDFLLDFHWIPRDPHYIDLNFIEQIMLSKYFSVIFIHMNILYRIWSALIFWPMCSANRVDMLFHTSTISYNIHIKYNMYWLYNNTLCSEQIILLLLVFNWTLTAKPW